jgi:hypothetical protein
MIKRIKKEIAEIKATRAYIRSLPKLTRNEFASWPDPNGEIRRTKERTHVVAAPESRTRFVLVRHSDGKVWCGPYAYDGDRFSSVSKNWYLYKNRDAAQSALDWSTWDFRVEVQEFEN